MMKYKLLAAIVGALVLVGCDDNVPAVDDPHNIVVNGKRITQAEFLEKYCAGKGSNETCMKVLQAARKDSTRGKMPKW
jgi:hypothetical protein